VAGGSYGPGGPENPPEQIGGSSSGSDQGSSSGPVFTWSGNPPTAADMARVAPRPDSADDTDEVRCHFLRSIGSDGTLSVPLATAVPQHRCAAFGDPLPLSLRQQELVCLQRVHVSCPRYLRGTVLASEAPVPVARERRSRRGILGLVALVLVIVALWILITGPILGVLPFGGGGSNPTLAPLVTPSPSAVATASAKPNPTATPKPSVTVAPSVKPSVAPTATPVPSATWPPGATASRMSLVTPCTDMVDCYIYVVRGPGASGNGSAVADTLEGIATFFGVDVARVRTMNGMSSNAVTVGQQLRIPPPTR
jgi:hypothetical protein